jgi:DNA-directed RNA polymerase sigma subunit (sigma70/sigma32)
MVATDGDPDPEGAHMDRLAYLPRLTTETFHDYSGQPSEPTARDYLKRVPDPDADVPERVISEIEAARIRRLVASLPKLHRLVIAWHYGLDGCALSRREIAERLRLRPAAVRRIEAEALRHLRCLVLAQGQAA